VSRVVVVDASALAATVFDEPEAKAIDARLEGAQVYAPALLKFELASVARKKIRDAPADAPKILAALNKALEPRRGIEWHDVDYPGVVLIAQETGLSIYDATYMWLAGWLGADLVTLDERLANAGTL
jgi:predicted nucleic acid-binding protein